MFEEGFLSIWTYLILHIFLLFFSLLLGLLRREGVWIKIRQLIQKSLYIYTRIYVCIPVQFIAFAFAFSFDLLCFSVFFSFRLLWSGLDAVRHHPSCRSLKDLGYHALSRYIVRGSGGERRDRARARQREREIKTKIEGTREMHWGSGEIFNYKSEHRLGIYFD